MGAHAHVFRVRGRVSSGSRMLHRGGAVMANILEFQPNVSTSTAHGVRGKMLEFKLPTEPCANCKRECNPDDLSMCLRCDTRYCKCSWDCPCDRFAREMVQRAGLEVLSCE